MKILVMSTVCVLAIASGTVAVQAAETAVQANDAGPVVQNSQAMAAADQLGTTSMRKQIQDQLSKAGYTGVTVTPSSFFVRAKDKMGNPVAMVIGPDSFTEVTDVAPKK